MVESSRKSGLLFEELYTNEEPKTRLERGYKIAKGNGLITNKI